MTQAPTLITGAAAPSLADPWPEDVNFFLALPIEKLQMDMVQSGRLNVEAIGRLRQVCRPLDTLFQEDDLFWKPLLKRDFPLQLRESAQDSYRRSHILRTNLIKGIFRSSCYGGTAILPEVPALAVVNGKIVSGGFDNTVAAWDIATQQQNSLLSLESCLSLAVGEGHLLFLGHEQGVVKVIDMQEGELTFNAHTSSVSSLAYAAGKLFSGDAGGNIKIWDWATDQDRFQKYIEDGVSDALILKEFKGHQAAIDALVVAGNTLISGDRDGVFQFWDLGNYECLHEFSYPTSKTFTVGHGKLIVGTDTGLIVIINIADGTITRMLMGHASIKSLFAFEDVFISENLTDRTIWDLSTGRPLLTVPRGDRPGQQYAYSEGKLFWIDDVRSVWSADYLVADDELFKEIALIFRARLDEDFKAMERFNRMPKKAREQIYLKFAEEYLQYADIDEPLEQWFNDSTYNLGKAQAIEAYLADRAGKEKKEVKI
jgi:hypothetical protein